MVRGDGDARERRRGIGNANCQERGFGAKAAVKNGNGGSSGDDWQITHRPLNSGICTTSPEVLEGTPDLTLS